MKKFIAMMAVALVAVSASAASIDWNFTGISTAAKRIKDSAGNDYTGNVYLILATDAALLNTSSTAAFESSLADITLGTSAISGGKAVSEATATSNKLADTTTSYTFQVVVYDGSKYYLSGALTNTAYDLNATPVTPSKITFTAQQIGPTYTKDWTAVPEPASAMLALAGVAMLIRRRK